MRPLVPLSLIEQTMEHLRSGFRDGHWRGTLPGIRTLARELDVSKDTVEVALRRLEVEGVIQSKGPGKRREIVQEHLIHASSRPLRIGVLLSDPLETINLNSQMLVLGMIRRIENTGHVCFMAEKSIRELGGKIQRVSRMVEGAKADAWVLYSPHRSLLEWFSRQPSPVLAIGGLTTGLPVSATLSNASQALEATVVTLTKMGHRRIVAVSPESWRIPSKSRTAEAFLEALEKNGHHPTAYNLPSWENTPEGLGKLLEELFRITPPTALLFVDPVAYVAALGFLSLRGLSVPRDISVVCMTSNPILGLLPRRVAHFKWPVEKHIHRVTRWVEQVANGSHKPTETEFHATFDPGETIGPVKGRSAGKR